MPKIHCAVAILAAGKGTRLKLDEPKALAPLLGKKMIDFTLDSLEELKSVSSNILFDIGIVVGHEKEKIMSHLDENDSGFHIAYQQEQLGTGHALQCFLKELPALYKSDYLIVTCADTPLITSDIYSKMIETLQEKSELNALSISFAAKNPYGYGRIKRGDVGFQIIEEADASVSEQLIKEVNSGLYIFKTSYLKKHLTTLNNSNNSGEFYLTDLFQKGEKVDAVMYKDSSLFLGINTLEQLAQAKEQLRERKLREFQDQGVLIEDKKSFHFDWNVKLEKGVHIYPQVHAYGNVVIKSGSVIEPFNVIKNSTLNEGVKVFGHSYLEEAVIDKNCTVGPFARLRPGTSLEQEVKVGNFCEIKKSTLKKGSKVSHLSYVGDAEIGENSNIGCGFITCNYDGANKHKTLVGKNVFIGSDCQAIAPVEIGDNSFVAAGSTINKNVPEEGFAIARARQVTKEKMASKFRKIKKD